MEELKRDIKEDENVSNQSRKDSLKQKKEELKLLQKKMNEESKTIYIRLQECEKVFLKQKKLCIEQEKKYIHKYQDIAILSCVQTT